MKRTKALAIPHGVKEAVAQRDSCENWPCCVICGMPAPTSNPYAFSCAHFISRAQGGLGIEENILTLCSSCHMAYDQTTERSALRQMLRRYLQDHYKDWNEDNLIYKKEDNV